MENKHFGILLPQLGLHFLFMYGIRDVGGAAQMKGQQIPSYPRQSGSKRLLPASQEVVKWVGKSGKEGKQDNLAKVERVKG